LVYPLWKELGDMWTGFGPFVKNIEGNREKLKGLASQEEEVGK
jgi:hypothetical protein